MENSIYRTTEEKIEREFFDFYTENTKLIQNTLNDAVRKTIASPLSLDLITDALIEVVDIFVTQECIEFEYDVTDVLDLKFKLLGLLKEILGANIRIQL